MDSVLLRLLFPPKCHFCRKVLTHRETDLCHRCREDAPEFTRSKRSFQLIAHWTAVWYYKGNVARSIRKFKFYNGRSYAKFYARAIAMKLKDEPFEQDIDILTWVPISPLRQFQRGYDQSELIAKALGKELGITPVRILKKIPMPPYPCGGIRKFNSGGLRFGKSCVELISLCIDIVERVRNGITNTDHARLKFGDVGADGYVEIC